MPAATRKLVGRRALVEAEREQPVRVDDEAELAGAERGERLDRGERPDGCPPTPHGDSVAELVDLVGIDVELRVAEAVDPEHLGDDRVALAGG